MLVLAESHRRQYANYQPVFWRVAPDAVERQRDYFTSLIADESIIKLIALNENALIGFIIGRLVAAPPVYNPGGPTCYVDDFAVDQTESWAAIGSDLLAATKKEAMARGAAQLVVVCGHPDEAKRTALRSGGLSIASEWWVTPLN